MSIKAAVSDHQTVAMTFPASTAVAIGDLLGNNSGAVKLASAYADGGSEALNQAAFAAVFMGVSADKRLSTETDTPDRVVLTDIIVDATCPTTTWVVGDFVGASEKSNGTQLEDQQVEKVATANLAIGYCFKGGTDLTTVRCRLISYYLPNVINRGLLDTSLADDTALVLGTGSDAKLLWSTADASNHSTVLALGDTNEGLHITDVGAAGTDWNIAATTHPEVYIHSNTTPATDYLRIGGHDGTTANIDVVGGTTLALAIAGTTQGNLTAAGIDLIDDNSFIIGTGLDAELLWSTADASDHGAVLALGDTSQMLHVTDVGAKASDWNITSPTHPTLYIHSNTTPITDYLLIGQHDGTTALIDVVGGTTLSMKIAGTERAALTATALTAGTGVVGVFTAAGLRTQQAVNNVHDTTPTAAELTTSFGDPATIGRGFVGTVDDADGDAINYIVWASDASYYFVKGTKAA